MTGAVMQLVAYGVEDIYLTGNPQVTFFKAVYRRHTNFALESISQTLDGLPGFGRTVSCILSRNGDLVNGLMLEVILPPTINGAWAHSIGHYLLDSVDLDIGGQLVDRHYGDWLEIWSQLTTPAEKVIGYRNMIGQGLVTANGEYGGLQSVNNHPATKLYIPLQFWFCRNVGLAVPLIALQYHEVKLKIKFADQSDVLLTGAVADDLKCTLYADYIYLDEDERRRFAQVSHEYLIEQLQFNGDESYTANPSYFQLTSFNHPVKELIWTCTDRSNVAITPWADRFFADQASGLIDGNGEDTTGGIDVDLAGNIYVGGSTTSNDLVTRTSVVKNGYIAKYNSTFTQRNWQNLIQPTSKDAILKWIGGTGTDTATSMVTDTDGNIYITGYTTGQSITINGTNYTGLTGTVTNGYVVKLDRNLATVWVSIAASALNIQNAHIDIDTDRNVYIMGATNDATQTTITVSTAGVGLGTVTSPTLTNAATYIYKLDPTGTALLWFNWIHCTTAAVPLLYYFMNVSPNDTINIGQHGHTKNMVYSVTDLVLNTTVDTTYSAAPRDATSGVLFSLSSDGSIRTRGTGTTPFVLWIEVSLVLLRSNNSDIYLESYQLNNRSIYNTTSKLADINAGVVPTYGVIKITNTAITSFFTYRLNAADTQRNHKGIIDKDGDIFLCIRHGNVALTLEGTTTPYTGTNIGSVGRWSNTGTLKWFIRTGAEGSNPVFNIDKVSNVIYFASSSKILILDANDGSTIRQLTNNATPFNILVNPIGDMYMYGHSAANISIDTTAYNLTAGNGQDAFLYKYRMTENGTAFSVQVKTDLNGNIYACGVADGTSTGIRIGTTTVTLSATATDPAITALVGTVYLKPTSGGRDLFLVKLNTNGVVQWVNWFCSTADENGYDFIIDANSIYFPINTSMGNSTLTMANLLANGKSNSTDNFTSTDTDTNKGVLYKLTLNGTLTWKVTTRKGRIYNTCVASDGSIIISGNLTGDIVITPTAGTPQVTRGTAGAWIASLTTAGALNWVNLLTGASLTSAAAADVNGNIYISTVANAALSIQRVNTATGALTGTATVFNKPADAMSGGLVKLDLTGKANLIRYIGSVVDLIRLDADNNLIITAYNSTAATNMSVFTDTGTRLYETGNGKYSIMLIKSDGDFAYAKSLSSNSQSNYISVVGRKVYTLFSVAAAAANATVGNSYGAAETYNSVNNNGAMLYYTYTYTLPPGEGPIADLYSVSTPIGVPFQPADNFAPVINAVNPVETALLKINGNDRFTVRVGEYFNLMQTYIHHTSTPRSRGINVYSFALHPEEHQPSGTCNFSRLDSCQLNLTYREGVAGGVMRLYAVNYNVLRIMSGMGGLAYSN